MGIFNNYSPPGLDLGSSFLKVVQLKKGKKGIQLKNYFLTETPAGAVKDGRIINPEPVADRLKFIFRKNNFKGKRVVTCVGGENAILRNLTLPEMKPGELLKVMKYEVARHISLPLDEVLYNCFRLRSLPEGKIEVLLLVISREIIEKHMEVIDRAGLYPAAVEVDIFALIRNFLFYFRGKNNDEEDNKAYILLDIGNETSNMVILEGNRYSFYRSLPLGGSCFSLKVMEADNISLEEAEERKKGKDFLSLSGALEAAAGLVKEVQRTLNYYLYKIEDKEIHSAVIFITGGASGIHGLNSYISTELKVETLSLNSFQFLKCDSQNILKTLGEDKNFLSIAFGLALRGWEGVSS